MEKGRDPVGGAPASACCCQKLVTRLATLAVQERQTIMPFPGSYLLPAVLSCYPWFLRWYDLTGAAGSFLLGGMKNPNPPRLARDICIEDSMKHFYSRNTLFYFSSVGQVLALTQLSLQNQTVNSLNPKFDSQGEIWLSTLLRFCCFFFFF